MMADSVDRYIDKIVQPVEYSMRGLEFVVDTANGAAFLLLQRCSSGSGRPLKSSMQIPMA